MPRLLVVHHTPSPAMQEMLEAVVRGARTDEIEGVEVVLRPALTAAAADVQPRAGEQLLVIGVHVGRSAVVVKHHDPDNHRQRKPLGHKLLAKVQTFGPCPAGQRP